MRGKEYEERLKLTTLEEGRLRGDLIQWYKLVNGFEEISWIKERCLGHPRPGVRSKYDAGKPLRTINNVKSSFTGRAPEVRNKLTDSVVKAGSVDSFTRLLDDHCRQGCLDET